MKKYLILLFAVVIICGTVLFVRGDNEVSAEQTNTNYELIGGVIRNSGNGWYAINDEGHRPLGITKVINNSQYITVSYANYSKVVSFNATVDETMAKQGYAVGASVGTNKTYIYIYKSGKLINPNSYKDKGGNIWVNGIFIK